MPRIAIIGAGLSGLATAHYLVKSLSDAGKEAEILLLEADAVPGGKMRTIRQDGFSWSGGRTASSRTSARPGVCRTYG